MILVASVRMGSSRCQGEQEGFCSPWLVQGSSCSAPAVGAPSCQGSSPAKPRLFPTTASRSARRRRLPLALQSADKAASPLSTCLVGGREARGAVGAARRPRATAIGFLAGRRAKHRHRLIETVGPLRSHTQLRPLEDWASGPQRCLPAASLSASPHASVEPSGPPSPFSFPGL